MLAPVGTLQVYKLNYIVILLSLNREQLLSELDSDSFVILSWTRLATRFSKLNENNVVILANFQTMPHSVHLGFGENTWTKAFSTKQLQYSIKVAILIGLLRFQELSDSIVFHFFPSHVKHVMFFFQSTKIICINCFVPYFLSAFLSKLKISNTKFFHPEKTLSQFSFTSQTLADTLYPLFYSFSFQDFITWKQLSYF